MWRRYGDAVYALIVLAVFAIETLALAFLMWTFALRRLGEVTDTRVQEVVVVTIGVTALALMLVMAYILTYQVLTSYRDRFRDGALQKWSNRWIGVMYQGEPIPPGPLSREAREALLDMAEELKGGDLDRLSELVEQYGIADRLLRQARPTRWSRWRSSKSSVRVLTNPRRMARRLDALEALAKARVDSAFDPLLPMIHDRERIIAVMALRAAARTLARVGPDDPRMADRAERFVEMLQTVDLPGGVEQESLIVLEGAAPAVLERVLVGDSPHRLRVAAFEAAGRLKEIAVIEHVAEAMSDRNPDIRAAAIRASAQIGLLPPRAEPALEVALADPVEFVRIQAAHAAYLLPLETSVPTLKRLLGDPSWWVRKAAASTLARMGNDGMRALHRAARKHTDRYAKHMAVQALLEAGGIDPGTARRLREAG